MTYIQDNLMKEEKIIGESKLHWVIFTRALFWLGLTIIVLFLGPYYPIINYQLTANIPPLYKLISIVALFIALINGFSAYIDYMTVELAITNRRVLMKTGLIRRSTIEILLPRIESINVYQSVLGRLLNYGTLLVSGTGGSKDPFANFADPSKLRNLIQEQIEATS